MIKTVVYLHPIKQIAMLRGHPWIFPKAIARTEGVLVTGELVRIMSADGNLLGVGMYNEHSLYRIRVLVQAPEPFHSLESLIVQRLTQACMVRQSVILPNDATTAYRVFNSEGDGLSGLTIDCFNQTYVVASSAHWVQTHRELITRCIEKVMHPKYLIWLAQKKPLHQDGWKTDEEPIKERYEHVLEAGVMFEVNFSTIQKTGLFLDQRENHQRIAALAHQKKVLDLYTYTGGFALHAKKAGASLVTAIDSSEKAIECAKRNAQLNDLDIEWVEDDARNHLAKSSEYDIIILDPPKLVPSRQHLQQAKKYIRFLHKELFQHMKPGAILMTCNCSSA